MFPSNHTKQSLFGTPVPQPFTYSGFPVFVYDGITAKLIKSGAHGFDPRPMGTVSFSHFNELIQPAWLSVQSESRCGCCWNNTMMTGHFHWLISYSWQITCVISIFKWHHRCLLMFKGEVHRNTQVRLMRLLARCRTRVDECARTTAWTFGLKTFWEHFECCSSLLHRWRLYCIITQSQIILFLFFFFYFYSSCDTVDLLLEKCFSECCWGCFVLTAKLEVHGKTICVSLYYVSNS